MTKKNVMKSAKFLLLFVCILWFAPENAMSDIVNIPNVEKKQSLDGLGYEGRENLKSVGRGYGQKICSGKEISKKEDIKSKAWSRIKGSCGKFTFGLQKNFTDDPNIIFSMCIGAALDGCQKQIGIKHPCHDLSSCQALLGVPD